MIRSLHRAVREDRMAHALLLTSGDAERVKSQAIGLAQHLVCDSRQSRDEGCGRCGPCVRMLARQSESLIRLEPENGVIKIDQVRPIREGLSLESWSGARIVMIENAENMNLQASNALLKVIEEPPAQTYFLLLAAQASALVPTIRSRCQLVRLGTEADFSPEPFLLENAQAAELSLIWWKDLARGLRVHDDQWRDHVRDRDQALTIVRIWSYLLHQSRRRAEGLKTGWKAAEEVMALLSRNPGAIEFSWRALLDLKTEIEAQVDRQLATESFFLRVSAEFAQKSYATS